MSVFDLKTSVEELASYNDGVSQQYYREINTLTPATGDSFPAQQLQFQWSQSADEWWVANRSYFRVQVKVGSGGTTAAPTPVLPLSSQVAYNANLVANLFQSMEYRLGDRTVCRQSAYVAQCEALVMRQSKSGAWLRSVGASTNFTNMKWDDRLQLTVGQGKTIHNVAGVAGAPTNATIAGGELATITTTAVQGKVEGASIEDTTQDCYVELIWKPASLSIFNYSGAIPCGLHNLVLTPEPDVTYKIKAVESAGANKVPGTDFQFGVLDFRFYGCFIKGPMFTDGSFLLDLMNVRCQTNNITTSSLMQSNFQVSPSCQGLTVAFQDVRAGQNTMCSPSRFKSYDGAACFNGTVYYDSKEMNLNRLYVQYNSIQKPQPDATPSFSHAGTISSSNLMTQRYAETQLNTGAYFDAGGGESFADWVYNGPYYYFQWPKSASSNDTRVTVNTQFSALNSNTTRVLLFDHYRSVARVTVKNGNVVDVQVDES